MPDHGVLQLQGGNHRSCKLGSILLMEREEPTSWIIPPRLNGVTREGDIMRQVAFIVSLFGVAA